MTGRRPPPTSRRSSDCVGRPVAAARRIDYTPATAPSFEVSLLLVRGLDVDPRREDGRAVATNRGGPS